jgi:hypothetical protein
MTDYQYQLKRVVRGYCSANNLDLTTCITDFVSKKKQSVMRIHAGMTWPVTIPANTYVILDVDVELSTTNHYLIIGGSNILITSASGTTNVQNVSLYPGFISNTTGTFSNIICQNMELVSHTSTLLNLSGWFAQTTSYTNFINCSSTGPISSGGGGIAGQYNYGTITRCNSKGDVGAVDSGGSGGGIAGDYNAGHIELCYSVGNLINNGAIGADAGETPVATQGYAGGSGGSGGLICGNNNTGLVRACYAIGDINNFGGAGGMGSTPDPYVLHVNGGNGGIGGNGGSGGGICGNTNSGSVINCYYLGYIYCYGGTGGAGGDGNWETNGNGGAGGTGGSGSGICGNSNSGAISFCHSLTTLLNVGGNSGTPGTNASDGVGGSGGSGGGICGDSNANSVFGCYTHGIINNYGGIGSSTGVIGSGGGICGDANAAVISNCYFRGKVSSTGTAAYGSGGIAGFVSTTGSPPQLTNCYVSAVIAEGNNPISNNTPQVNCNQTVKWDSKIASATLIPQEIWCTSNVPYTLKVSFESALNSC